jgi:hypothetical protein
MVEIMTLWSPHKLLKNLQPSSTKIKKIEILILSILDTMEWTKKHLMLLSPLRDQRSAGNEVVRLRGCDIMISSMRSLLGRKDIMAVQVMRS